jgi:hypothetical protein
MFVGKAASKQASKQSDNLTLTENKEKKGSKVEKVGRMQLVQRIVQAREKRRFGASPTQDDGREMSSVF